MARQPLMIESASAELLRRASDHLLLGLIYPLRGTVELFEARRDKYAGHRDLVRAGLLRLPDVRGFSLETARGEVVAFYRTSILNFDCDDFAMPRDMMENVLAALALPLAKNFRAFPS